MPFIDRELTASVGLYPKHTGYCGFWGNLLYWYALINPDNMKKSFFLLLILFFAEYLQAQVYWLQEYEVAKSVARETGKLIVIDFGANWCGPCKEMDRELWESSEIKEAAKNFIGLKVNIDYYRALATAYHATAIPKVVIVTLSGDVIWENIGFSGLEPYRTILNAIPGNADALNKCAIAYEANNKDPNINFELGLAFQNLGKEIKNGVVKSSFLNYSLIYFVKAQKYSRDENQQAEIELYSILNDVYFGKPAKALRRMDKIVSRPENKNFEDIRHFVFAKSYFGNHDLDNYRREKLQIGNKDLLAQLE